MSDRLSLAVENGHVALPEGDILVIGATADSDLAPLDPSRTRVLSRYADAHQRLADQGWTTLTDSDDPVDAVLLILPRAREAQRACLRDARRRTDGPIIVDGTKTDGVDAFYKEVRKRADVTDAYSKAHGKVFAVTGGTFDDWPDDRPREDQDGWWRAPGVFSATGLDPATALLSAALPPGLSGRVADLGAGWGALARAVLARDAVESLDLVENDRHALTAARHNITDDRATFHWADVRTWRPSEPLDHIVTNPPFHTGRKADASLGQAFIEAASGQLAPRGTLWLVANRHLPYERALAERFGEVTELDGTSSFKIFAATRPRRGNRG